MCLVCAMCTDQIIEHLKKEKIHGNQSSNQRIRPYRQKCIPRRRQEVALADDEHLQRGAHTDN